MRFLLAVILCFSAFSSTHAGLFEYYLTGEWVSNTTVNEYADTIESIHPNNVKNKPSYTANTHYRDTRYDWTYGNLRISPSRDYRKTYISSGNFYKRNDLVDILEDELDFLEDEAKSISRAIDRVEDDIKDAKRFTSRYYRDLRDDLEDELEYLKEREDDIKDLRKDLKSEIRSVKNNTKHQRNSRYYNYYNDLYDNRYDRGYYNRYDYYYDRSPSWVNPDLEDVKQGRIYIR